MAKSYIAMMFVFREFLSPKIIAVYQTLTVGLDAGICTYAAFMEPDAFHSFYFAVAFCLAPSTLVMWIGIYTAWPLLRNAYEPIAGFTTPTERTPLMASQDHDDDDVGGPLSNVYSLQQTHRQSSSTGVSVPEFKTKTAPAIHRWMSSQTRINNLLDDDLEVSSGDVAALKSAFIQRYTAGPVQQATIASGAPTTVHPSFGTMAHPSSMLQFCPQQRLAQGPFFRVAGYFILLILLTSVVGACGSVAALLSNGHLNPESRSWIRTG
jgi:hypothetical protein